MREFHILNLGAGVQSTTLALLFEDGRFPVKLDAAIFADTQEESREVYDHLEKLKSRLSFPVIIRTAGKLGDHIMTGTNSTGGRFAPIPAFTLHADGNKGITRRQCTKEYKIDVIERAIRRDVLGLAPRKRIPSGVLVHQYIGISLDEAGRMLKMKNRLEEKPVRWARYHFPLIEELGWTRRDCREYLATKIDYRVPRSACVFCPYHDNSEWARLKSAGGPEWDRVVQIDRALRTPGNVVNRNMDSQLFLHSSCQPIDEIDFLNSLQGELGFNAECLGMCGS